jgi:catechol 2,3-dioxygenase-like lactoylglutathione lyase family enzyme
MTLTEFKYAPAVAVTDLARARDFYEGKLGLADGQHQPDGGITYRCADATSIHVYPSAEHAGQTGATLGAWETDDVERLVDELTASGVWFERYDTERIKTDEKGIATFGDPENGYVKHASFKDPDGNTLGIYGG